MAWSDAARAAALAARRAHKHIHNAGFGHGKSATKAYKFKFSLSRREYASALRTVRSAGGVKGGSMKQRHGLQRQQAMHMVAQFRAFNRRG